MHNDYISIYTAKVYIVCTVRYMHGNYISIYTVWSIPSMYGTVYTYTHIYT